MKGLPKVGGSGDQCVEHCYFLATLSLMQQIASEGYIYIYIYIKRGEGHL